MFPLMIKTWNFIKKNANTKLKCGENSKKNKLINLHIRPDLKLFLCLNVFISNEKIITDYNSINEVNNNYYNINEFLKWKIPLYNKCKKCGLFINKVCQGGCLGNKLANIKNVKLPNDMKLINPNGKK